MNNTSIKTLISKKFPFYLVAFALLILIFLFFSRAYNELMRYTELTNRANTVYITFQKLSIDINNAAVQNPGLIGAANSSKIIKLFPIDSQSIIKQTGFLKSTVRDSINTQIAEKLDTAIKAELSWILKSNVPDSIIGNKSPEHIAAFQRIDSLINQGIQRTDFLLEYRKKKLNEAHNKVKTWMILFILFSVIMLCYTSIGFFKQKSKTKRKEMDLKKIMDSSLDVICAVDAKGRFIQVSAASEAIWGYKPDELIGRSIFDLVYPEDHEETRKTASKVMAGKNMINFNNRYIRKDGSLVHIEWTARWDAKDQVRYGVARDATKKLEIQKIIEDNQRQLAVIYNTISDIVFMLNIEDNNRYKFASVNHAFLEITGLSDEQIVGHFVNDVIPSASLELVLTKYKEAITNKKTVSWEETTSYPSGTKTGFVTISPVTDEDGNCTMLVGSVHDITERKKIEKAVTKALEEKNIILESIGDAFFAVDKNWIVTYWNNQAEKILGRPKNEIVGYHLWDVYSDSIDSESYKKYHQAIETCQVVHFEDYYPPLNKWYEISAYPSDNGLSVYFKDVTERKLSDIRLNELNENLQKQAKELAISNTELEQFAYVASHDLQEPLRTITSFLNLLEKKYENVMDDKGKKYIYFAVDGATRMRQIILDLLEYSRAGRTEYKRENIDLKELVNEIKILFLKQVEEKSAVIHVGDLPAMYAYKVPLRQVFQNLIGNALKYTKKDVPAQINISAEELKDHWQFAVTDNGIGIDKDQFEKIFIIFQRLHSKKEYSGTGIGLAITKKIIEAMGGKIWVESNAGNGSAFYFTIPKM